VQGYHRARIEPSEAIDQSRYLGVHENSPVPIIRFVQSDQLEARLTYRLGKNSMRGEMLQRKIRAFQKHWHKISYQVLNEISKVTNIPWVEKDINVYLIPGVDSFSSPLCVAFRDNTDTTNTLVHELIHRNFRQIDTEKHRERMRQRIREVAQPFEPLLKLTRNHIVIHAVHKIIFDRCFKPAQEKRQRELHEKHGSYRRAWEIVDEVGAANIVKQFMR
jgi:hypothetical protein